jgi:hypothetical protein
MEPFILGLPKSRTNRTGERAVEEEFDKSKNSKLYVWTYSGLAR